MSHGSCLDELNLTMEVMLITELNWCQTLKFNFCKISTAEHINRRAI